MQENVVSNFIDNSKLGKFHITLVALGVFLIAFTGYGATAYGSIITSITSEWNLNVTVLGYMGSLSEFGSMFGAVILSIISNRLGVKKVLIGSVLIFCVFTFGQSVVNTPVLFAIFRFLAGVGFGGVIPLVISLLSEYAPKSSKSKSVAIALCGNQIGSIIASLLAIVILPRLGWRPVLWMAFVPILFLVFIIKLVPESAQYLVKHQETEKLKKVLERIDQDYTKKIDLEQLKTMSAEGIQPEKKVSYFALFNSRFILVTLLACIIYIMGLLFINGVIVWLPGVMVQNGFSLGSSLAFSIFLNVGTIAGTVVWGAVADRKGFKVLLPAIYGIGAVVLMLMGVKTNIIILYLFVFLIGFFLFSAHSLVNAFVSQHYPEELRTSAVGLVNSVGRLGGIFGPTLGGLLLSANASISTWFVTFGATGLIAAASFVAINLITKSKEAEIDKADAIKG